MMVWIRSGQARRISLPRLIVALAAAASVISCISSGSDDAVSGILAEVGVGDFQHRPGRAADAAGALGPLLGQVGALQGLLPRGGGWPSAPASWARSWRRTRLNRFSEPMGRLCACSISPSRHLQDLRAAAADVEHRARAACRLCQHGAVVAELGLRLARDHVHRKAGAAGGLGARPRPCCGCSAGDAVAKTCISLMPKWPSSVRKSGQHRAGLVDARRGRAGPPR